MGRAPSTAASKKDGAAAAAVAEEEAESKRLHDLSFSRGLLSRFKATPASPLWPSNALLKADGKDIVKKGHRKSKYLFSFPGLLAPISGGSLGELTNLDSRNPILYIDFPQGRLKLFGTIIYPKNKYLMLQFPKGTGDIICEDCFESLVVFSEGWWIGTKQENPYELRLDWPKELIKEKFADVDFGAGAGRTHDSAKSAVKDEFITPEKQFKLEIDHEPENSDDLQDDRTTCSIPVRQSARTAGKKLNYADSEDDDDDDDDDVDDDDDDDDDEHLQSKIKKKQSAVKHTIRIHSFNVQKGTTESSLPITLDCEDNSAKVAGKTFESWPADQKDLALETGVAKISEGVLLESSISGTNASSTILKQSSLTPFLGKSLKKEDIDIGQPSAVVAVRKDIVESSAKQAAGKRPRKAPSMTDKKDASLESGRKQLKNIKGVSDPEGADVTPKSIGSIRKKIQDKKGNNKEGGRDLMPKMNFLEKQINAVTPKRKKKSDSDEDFSDVIESDDSDEDWVA